MKSLSQEFASFIKDLSIENTPAEVVLFAKQLALKTLAGMVAGSATPSAPPVMEYVKKVGGPLDAGVCGSNFKCMIENAILANGHFAHAAELEDDCFPAPTSDITIVPVIFPLAEHLKLSGKAVVEAIIAGCETMNRLSLFTLTHRGISELPFFGIIGATATVAKAMDLNEEQIQNAIGISIGRASGFLSNLGTDAHYLESAMCCRDAYFSVLMAQQGMTGTTDIEGWLAYLLGRDDLPFEDQVKDLGGKGRWFTQGFWIKKYPNCFLTHRHIDIVKSIQQKNYLDPSKVESVEIFVGDVDYRMCDRPEPADYESARFSFQHLIASVILDGDIDFDSFTEERRDCPLVKELRKKVKVILRKEDPVGVWMSGIAKVKIAMSDGTTYEDDLEQSIGGPKDPLSTEQFIELYRKYTRNFLGEEEIVKTAEIVLSLEKQPDVTSLMNMLTCGR